MIANSSQFAAEAIGAFRTVTSLTLEDMISTRYDVLLKDHVKKAFDKAKYSTLIFALSDSVPLACMALTFYYGGTLLASREYGAINFFVVYIAVINGAESAGSFLSFGPSKSGPYAEPYCVKLPYHSPNRLTCLFRFCASSPSSQSNHKLQSQGKASQQVNCRAAGYRRRC